VNLTGMADGTYDLAVVLANNGNVKASATTPSSGAMVIDSTGPTVSMTAPSNGALLNTSTPTLSATATDATSGVASVQFQTSPSGLGTWSNNGTADTTSPYSVTSVALAEGVYDVHAIATDNSGNGITSALTTFTVDVTAPTVTITKPVAGQLYSTLSSPAVS